ncbi:MAG: hypothetical protein VYC96_03500 [Actinomycetota bacterium]|nr:hypothetical protein [Actinomycetota bacterium]
MSAPAILPTGDNPRVRESDPDTSHAAADSITPEGREASELEVLTILRAATSPITAEQIESRHTSRAGWGETPHHYTASRLRTALKQLADDGLVERTLVEGRTKSGRRAATWQITGGAS